MVGEEISARAGIIRGRIRRRFRKILPIEEEEEAGEDEAQAGMDADPPAFDASDPLRMLAEAAGYSESEQWWEHLVEQHRTQPAERNRFIPRSRRR